MLTKLLLRVCLLSLNLTIHQIADMGKFQLINEKRENMHLVLSNSFLCWILEIYIYHGAAILFFFNTIPRYQTEAGKENSLLPYIC